MLDYFSGLDSNPGSLALESVLFTTALHQVWRRSKTSSSKRAPERRSAGRKGWDELREVH